MIFYPKTLLACFFASTLLIASSVSALSPWRSIAIVGQDYSPWVYSENESQAQSALAKILDGTETHIAYLPIAMMQVRDDGNGYSELRYLQCAIKIENYSVAPHSAECVIRMGAPARGISHSVLQDTLNTQNYTDINYVEEDLQQNGMPPFVGTVTTVSTLLFSTPLCCTNGVTWSVQMLSNLKSFTPGAALIGGFYLGYYTARRQIEEENLTRQGRVYKLIVDKTYSTYHELLVPNGTRSGIITLSGITTQTMIDSNDIYLKRTQLGVDALHYH